MEAPHFSTSFTPK